MPIVTATDDDIASASQIRPTRRLVAIGLVVAAATYFVCLIATIPAALVFESPRTISISGTVWDGAATLPGGHEAIWTADATRSIMRLAFAVNWTLTGPNTNMTGRASFGLGGIAVDDVSGRVGTSLVKAFAPGVALCDGEARIELRHFRWSRAGFEADGTLRSSPASCPHNAASTTVSPLLATLSDSNGAVTVRVTGAEAPATILATASLDPGGRLVAELRPEAATVIPGLPITSPGAGPYRLETTVSMP